MRTFASDQKASRCDVPGRAEPIARSTLSGRGGETSSRKDTGRDSGSLLAPQAVRGDSTDAPPNRGIAVGFFHKFNGIPVYPHGRTRLQAKMNADFSPDVYEREADRIADQLVDGPGALPGRRPAAPGTAPATVPPVPPMRASDGNATPVDLTPLHAVLASPGKPLDAGPRADMEARFGHDFSRVRVHRDALAARSAPAIGARAYTFGQDIVFGPGQYSPDTRAGRRLIAHELTHVLQQGGARALTGKAPGIRTATGPRQPARSPQQAGVLSGLPARSPDFAQLWRSFSHDMIGPISPQLRERARTVLNALIATGSRQDRQTHGLDLALWFHDHGMSPEADRALSAVEGAWLVGAVLRQSDVPRAIWASSMQDGANALIGRAERAARANRHPLAFRLFGLAYLFLQMQLVQATERRATQLASAAGTAIAPTTRAMFSYPTVGLLYNRMRRVLGFYLQLEREATAAGDTRRATRLAVLAVRFEQNIRNNFMWSGEAMIAEVSRVQTSHGSALRIHGTNNAETDVTAFQGQDTPEEIGARSYQWQTLEGLQQSLRGQVQFLGELRRHPEIQREFRNQTINPNDLSQRLRIWRTMLNIYRGQGSAADALASLMALIGRYLRAFTHHTQYNIRDWGQNYLTSDMPVDLAGRLARDCGVYALTVAYEVFRTARGASPRMNLAFEITVVPGHVVLVIYDRDNNSFYLVNNSQISPRRSGGRAEAEEAVAPAAAGALGGLRNFVTPGIRMDLGSTALPVGRFRRQAWSRYREASGWSLAPAQRSGPGDRRTDTELSEAGHRQFYEQQRQFDRRSRRLGGVLDGLGRSLVTRSNSEQLTELQRRLPGIAVAARQLGLQFITLGPAAPIGVDPARPQLIQRLRPHKRYLFSWQPPGSAHPLARTAMALLRLQHLGGTLSVNDQAFITWCGSVDAFRRDIDSYRRRSFPAGF